MRSIAKMTRKRFKELADFLWEHVTDTLEQVYAEEFNKQKSVRLQLQDSTRREEAMQESLKLNAQVHEKEVSALKQCFLGTSDGAARTEIQLLETTKALEISKQNEAQLKRDLQKVEQQLLETQR